MNDREGGQRDLAQEIDDLKMAQAVQAASTAGAQATQAAAQAGQAAATAAAFAGTWSTVAVGAVALIVGIFLGLVMDRR